MFTDDAVLLIDSDSIYFQVACVLTKQNEIRKAIDFKMNNIRRQCMSDKMLVAIKGRGNFRNDLYSKYKANRPELKPEVKKALNYGHKYMIDKYGAVMADDMEADDLVCIWAHECIAAGQEYTIVGIDKDLLQIPGNHYNFKKETHTLINEDEGNLKLMLQCLTGDNADNIPGLKGIGPKKAEKILAGTKMDRRWGRVKAAWRAHGAGSPDLSRQLLTMLTSWDDLDAVKTQIQDKATERQPDVGSEGTEIVQES